VLTWDELRARGTPCLRCRWAEPIAGPLSPAGRERVAAAFTGHLNAEVFRRIREDTGCGLAAAKGMVQHLVDKAGECHWCGAAIPVAELVDCPGCRALNILLVPSA
jgi:hypothetical protein